jgi:hypothetical protein
MIGSYQSAITLVALTQLFSIARAQEAGSRQDRDHTWLDFHCIGAPMVQEELKLSVDQTLKVKELAESFRSEIPRSSKRRSEMTPEERKQFDEERGRDLDRRDAEYRPKLAAALTENQNRRLREIEIQVLLSLNGPTSTDAMEIAKPLGVSEEQKSKLRQIRTEWFDTFRKENRTGTPEELRAKDNANVAKRDESANAVLTPDQRAKLVELQGKPFDIPRLQAHWRNAVQK